MFDVLDGMQLNANFSYIPSFNSTGRVYPVAGTGNNVPAIQAALDTCRDAGGGTVDLGNAKYVCSGSSGLTLDCSSTSLVGQGAVLDFSTSTAANAITINQQIGAARRGYNLAHEIAGIVMLGNNGPMNGLYFNQPTNPNQETAHLSVRNMSIGNIGKAFTRGVLLGNNTYIAKFYSCSIGYATHACLDITGIPYNMGEAVDFFGCTFYNSERALDIGYDGGVNADLHFFGCSFDYNKSCIRALTTMHIECFGCHFESNITTPYQFELDNGSYILVSGGSFLLGAPTMFQMWGNGGDVMLQNVLVDIGTNALTNKPQFVRCSGVHGQPGTQGWSYGVGVTLTPNMMRGDYLVHTLTADSAVAAPLHGTRGAVLNLVLKQAATGGPFTATFNSAYNFGSGGAPTMPVEPGATLLVRAVYEPTSIAWYCTSSVH